MSCNLKTKLQRCKLDDYAYSWHDEITFALNRVVFLHKKDFFYDCSQQRVHLGSDTRGTVTISLFDNSINAVVQETFCDHAIHTCICYDRNYILRKDSIRRKASHSLFVRTIGRVLRKFKQLGDVATIVQAFLWNHAKLLG